jgi:23S rRNA (cytosine1962-C5)-methyltransferase
MLSLIRLKKGADRRIRSGHPWIFSNEVDNAVTPLKSFTAGQEVLVMTHDKTILGTAYVNPHSLISGRIFSRKPDETLNDDFFQRQLRQALAIRERLFSRPYYRMVFSEGDNLPGLVIDRFANDYVIQINTAGMELKKDIIVSALCTVLPDVNSVLFRNDSHVREHEGLELYVNTAFGEPPEESTLEENGVSFTVPLWKGQKTGWFYDHRLNRARLQHYVPQGNVLDVFSYAGGFGIQAASFGASQVDCIEASAFAALCM